jgi:hypothetical protein
LTVTIVCIIVAVDGEVTVDDPFDARKVMLSDHGQPTSSQRTVSLVTALRAALLEAVPGVPKSDPKVQDLRKIVDELTSRGLDGDSLVRYGLLPELIAGVVAQTLSYWMPSLRIARSAALIEPPDMLPDAPRRPTGTTWANLLGPAIQGEMPQSEVVHLASDSLAPVLDRILRKAIPWVLSATIDDLLTLRPPAFEQLQTTVSALGPESVTLNEYRWIIDRFATTHLSEWSTPSLHQEYGWRQGTHPPPCAETLMGDRLVVDRDLNDEIARRAVEVVPLELVGAPAGLSIALLAKLRSTAIEFLRAERASDAAALFELALKESPRDAQLVNNLGFCLIPQDPRRALIELEKARRLGYHATEVNLHNRALCKILLGEYRTALAMVQDFWPRARSESALLWRQTPQGLRLRDAANSRDELAYLAYRAATFLGDDDAIEQWSRLANIENGDR